MKHGEMEMQIAGNNSGNKMYYFNILKYLLCSFDVSAHCGLGK